VATATAVMAAGSDGFQARAIEHTTYSNTIRSRGPVMRAPPLMVDKEGGRRTMSVRTSRWGPAHGTHIHIHLILNHVFSPSHSMPHTLINCYTAKFKVITSMCNLVGPAHTLALG
jgi:hypothetical protein